MTDQSRQQGEMLYQLHSTNPMAAREDQQWFQFIGNNPFATQSEGFAKRLTSYSFPSENEVSFIGEGGMNISSSPDSSETSAEEDSDSSCSSPDRRMSPLSSLFRDLKTSESASPPTESVSDETHELEQMSFANPCFSDDENEDLALVEHQRVSILRAGPSRRQRSSPFVRYSGEVRTTQVSGGEGSSQQQSTSEGSTQEQSTSSDQNQQSTSSSDEPDTEQSSSNTNTRNQAVQTGVPGGRLFYSDRPSSSSSSSAGTASSLAGSSNMSTPRDAIIPHDDVASQPQFPGTPEDTSVVGLNAVDRRITEYALASGRATGEAAGRRQAEEFEAARLREEQRQQEEQRQLEEQRRQEEERQREEEQREQDEQQPLLFEDTGIDITEGGDVQL